MIADQILEFTFSGDPADPIQRHKTGLYSFDRSFAKSDTEWGVPLGTGIEVFGAKSTGKSTFCYSLAAMLGKSLGVNIVDADLEGFDPGHFTGILSSNGFTGDVKLIHQGSDEEILEKFENAFLERPDGKKKKYDGLSYGIGILDSIAAISPVAEREGDLSQANMGRRAFLMAQFSRRLLPTVYPRKIGSRNVYFLTNHWYEKLGTKGYQSPGGSVKDYLCGCQIHLTRKYVTVDGKSSRSYPDGSYILNGTLYKNRYGMDRTTFQVFVKGGYGIHKGLTAVLDAQEFGLAATSGYVKISDKSYGYFSQMVKNEWQNDDFFTPFYEVLDGYTRQDSEI